MRLVAALLTVTILAGLWPAGRMLYAELTDPPQAPVPAVVAAALQAAGSGPQPPMRWPPLFGEPQPPAPPEPEPPAPEPEPQPPAPPIDGLGYSLKGVVRVGDTAWALVSHPTGERLVRPGDALGEGLTVERIDGEGVWVARPGAAPGRLGFAD